ncbi:MAG: ABC transporter ATP-binding protein [Phycisphaerales bacterium]|nr:ABC transporter ATP-binding protein [Phycisphaerales bacterium]
MSAVKVEVSQLGKDFKRYRHPLHRMIEWLSAGSVRRHDVFTALDDINFTVHQGEFFGIVGPNGAGKSTLLKILTGVLSPTRGRYHIDGRVTSLLELGTGFNPDLTGRENIINSSRMLGFTERYIRERSERMIEFAEIGDYIDHPIKYYSSGMLVRLAFSIFAHVEPDVFIIDEALSVGDVYFSQKCFRRLDEMRKAGCTVLFVSHDLAALRKYCDQAMYLHQGRCRFMGSAIEATDLYLEAMSPGGRARNLAPQYNGGSSRLADNGHIAGESRGGAAGLPPTLAAVFDENAFARVAGFQGARIGTGAARIAAVRVCDGQGKPRERFTLLDPIHIHVLCDVREEIKNATVGIQLANRMGIVVWGTNHERLTGRVLRLRGGTRSHAHFLMHPGLGHGEYTLDVGYGDASGEGHVFDRLTGVARIEIAPEGDVDFVGLARIPCEAFISEHAVEPSDQTSGASSARH